LYYQKQRVTSTTTLPAVTASNIGLVATATNFAVGDRGCFPLIGAAAATQTATVQLVLQGGSGTLTAAAINTDYGAYVTLLCATSGTCCTTNLCNTSAMSRVEVSFGAMFMSTLAMFLWKL
jgi:hypothetical protein